MVLQSNTIYQHLLAEKEAIEAKSKTDSPEKPPIFTPRRLGERAAAPADRVSRDPRPQSDPRRRDRAGNPQGTRLFRRHDQPAHAFTQRRLAHAVCLFKEKTRSMIECRWLPRFFLRRICCCWTSRRTIWTSARSSGSRISWRTTAKPSWWSRTTGTSSTPSAPTSCSSAIRFPRFHVLRDSSCCTSAGIMTRMRRRLRRRI